MEDSNHEVGHLGLASIQSAHDELMATPEGTTMPGGRTILRVSPQPLGMETCGP